MLSTQVKFDKIIPCEEVLAKHHIILMAICLNISPYWGIQTRIYFLGLSEIDFMLSLNDINICCFIPIEFHILCDYPNAGLTSFSCGDYDIVFYPHTKMRSSYGECIYHLCSKCIKLDTIYTVRTKSVLLCPVYYLLHILQNDIEYKRILF